MESANLPPELPEVVEKIVLGGVRFYPASFGTGKGPLLAWHANGGSRHSKAAIAEKLNQRKGKAIVDGQFFLSKEDRWLPRAALVGPMQAKHGAHVPRSPILEKRIQRNDGAHVCHYWDVFGAGGWNHALISKRGRSIGISDEFARDVAPTAQFKNAHPDHVLVELPRYEGRNL